jgi:hypothetical protein
LKRFGEFYPVKTCCKLHRKTHVSESSPPGKRLRNNALFQLNLSSMFSNTSESCVPSKQQRNFHHWKFLCVLIISESNPIESSHALKKFPS